MYFLLFQLPVKRLITGDLSIKVNKRYKIYYQALLKIQKKYKYKQIHKNKFIKTKIITYDLYLLQSFEITASINIYLYLK
jgi:hypothetical protein